MFKFLKDLKIKKIVWSCLLVVIGLLFCIMKGKAVEVLETIISGGLIVYGFLCLLGYLFTPTVLRTSELLVESVMWIFAGGILAFIPSLFMIGTGVIIVVEGVRELGYCVELKKTGSENWCIDEIIGFVLIALGLTVVILANTTAEAIVSILLGLSILTEGVTNLFLIFVMKRDVTKLKQSILKDSLDDESDANSGNNSQSSDDFKDFNVK